MICIYDSEEVQNRQFVHAVSGVSYPSNWCACATVEDMEAIGMVHLDEVYPELEPGNSYLSTYVDVIDGLTGTRTYDQGVIVVDAVDGIITYTHADNGSTIPNADHTIIIDATDGDVILHFVTAAEAFNIVTQRSTRYFVKRIDNTANAGIIDETIDGIEGMDFEYMGRARIVTNGSIWITT